MEPANLVRLTDLIDTQFEAAKSDYRALVIFNPLNWNVSGWACFAVSMPFRAGNRPKEVFLFDECGTEVECGVFGLRRLIQSDTALQDRDWWAFTVMIRINDLPPYGFITLRAEWGSQEAHSEEHESPVLMPLSSDDPNPVSPLLVKEAIPHSGVLPKSGTWSHLSTREVNHQQETLS